MSWSSIPQGDKLVGNSVVLTDTLRDGTIENLLVVLESGGRIAAARGTRTGDITTLDNAIYSPCPVTKPSGCPRNPSWSITAARVVYDPNRNRVRFQGGRLQLFGVTLPLLPVFSIGTASGSGGVSGWLVPEISFSSRNGLEVGMPYYQRFSTNRDLTLTPRLYTGTWPAFEAKYRHLNSLGAFQIGAFGTYGRIDDPDPNDPTPDTHHGFRAYFEGNGKAQFNPPVEPDQLVPGRDRQDRYPTLRHHPRRPAAQLRQRRADQPCVLHQHRRLGVPGPARRRCAEADPDRAAGDRRPLPLRRAGGRRECGAAGQQPRHPQNRRPGHPARLRRCALGPAAADDPRTAAPADRLCPRRSLSHR